LKVTTSAVIYDPIGYCIYCGAVPPNLSNEHIIPYGLGGNHILPKSSCVDCAKITSQFELNSLRSLLGNFRVRQNIQSRRPKRRPKTLTLKTSSGDQETVSTTVAVDIYPEILMLPIPGRAGILEGHKPTSAMVLLGGFSCSTLESKNIHLESEFFRLEDFMSMLAKIAHAYVYGEYGAEKAASYRRLLPDRILQRDQTISYVVGGGAFSGTETSQPNDTIHAMRCFSFEFEKTERVIVEIKLFANWSAPTYHVVFGYKNVEIEK
jgi:hypothetical protein